MRVELGEALELLLSKSKGLEFSVPDGNEKSLKKLKK